MSRPVLNRRRSSRSPGPAAPPRCSESRPTFRASAKPPTRSRSVCSSRTPASTPDPAENETHGFEMAADAWNKRGGVMGRKIELVKEDEQNDPGVAAQKARKLVNQDKVAALVRHGVERRLALGRRRREHARHAVHGLRRPQRRRDRQELPLERVPHVPQHVDGDARDRLRAAEALRQEVVLHHAGLRVRTFARDRLQGRARAQRRQRRRQRAHAARHDRLQLVPHQDRRGETRPRAGARARRRLHQLPQADEPVRTAQEVPGRRAAGRARAAARPAARKRAKATGASNGTTRATSAWARTTSSRTSSSPTRSSATAGRRPRATRSATSRSTASRTR